MICVIGGLYREKKGEKEKRGKKGGIDRGNLAGLISMSAGLKESESLLL